MYRLVEHVITGFVPAVPVVDPSVSPIVSVDPVVQEKHDAKVKLKNVGQKF